MNIDLSQTVNRVENYIMANEIRKKTLTNSTRLDDFVHRFNRDGSIDSICTTCAQTVATSSDEFRLKDQEINHVCDRALLKKPPQRSELHSAE